MDGCSEGEVEQDEVEVEIGVCSLGGSTCLVFPMVFLVCVFFSLSLLVCSGLRLFFPEFWEHSGVAAPN
jgi:hypothetical protein